MTLKWSVTFDLLKKVSVVLSWWFKHSWLWRCRLTINQWVDPLLTDGVWGRRFYSSPGPRPQVWQLSDYFSAPVAGDEAMAKALGLRCVAGDVTAAETPGWTSRATCDQSSVSGWSFSTGCWHLLVLQVQTNQLAELFGYMTLMSRPHH